MNSKERRELISRIERKEYVTYETPKYPVKNTIVLASVLALLYLALLLTKNVLSSSESHANIFEIIEKIFSFYPEVAVGIFVLFAAWWLVKYLKKESLIFDLGRISAKDKKLILSGEILEANLESVTDSARGTIVKCGADYDGQRLHFESPAIRAQILPFKENKIKVFIDKNNPQDYLVNIYEHIPRRGPKILSNREELKFGEKTDEEHWRRIILSIACAILLIFLWPFLIGLVVLLLTPIVEVVLAIKNDDMISLSGFMLLLALEIAVVLFVRNSLKKSGVINNGSRGWRPSDYYLNVMIDKYWTTEYVVRGEKGKTTHKVHHISARYIEPKTNYMYEFYTTGPNMIARLVNKEVRVYVNPKNMEKYYIDYPTALRENSIKYDITGFTFDENGVWYEK